jgi:electron transfer flavoprotein alpha/beta subunit
MNEYSFIAKWIFFHKSFRIIRVMKIIVLMKQVANKDAVLRIGKDEKWIDDADIAMQTNESDGYALEEALRMKEAKGGGEVIVCTLGGQSAKTVIKDALARGADRAIHIVAENTNGMSPYTIAKTIAEAIREENADLVYAIGRQRLRTNGRNSRRTFRRSARDFGNRS